MKPVYQTILGPPNGNCLQASVASILELELDQVPNFMDAPGEEWQDALETFLAAYGLQSIAIDAPGDWQPAGWHLISGPSPRGDYWHVLVGYAGEPVHDPFPGGDCELVSKEIYRLFIALDPSERGA